MNERKVSHSRPGEAGVGRGRIEPATGKRTLVESAPGAVFDRATRGTPAPLPYQR